MKMPLKEYKLSAPPTLENEHFHNSTVNFAGVRQQPIASLAINYILENTSPIFSYGLDKDAVLLECLEVRFM